MENYAMRFYEQDEFKAMLEDAGFTRIRMTKPFGNTLADADDKTVVFQTYRKR
jgi:ubiquinone/menaquinone biosynthesis C-methylase UbiE